MLWVGRLSETLLLRIITFEKEAPCACMCGASSHPRKSSTAEDAVVLARSDSHAREVYDRSPDFQSCFCSMPIRSVRKADARELADHHDYAWSEVDLSCDATLILDGKAAPFTIANVLASTRHQMRLFLTVEKKVWRRLTL